MCLIFILLLGDFDTLCGVDVYVDVDVDVIYKYLCPLCLLSPHNQEGTLLLIITYVLYPSCFCKIWALCVSWIYLNLRNLSRCLISKRRSSIGETLIKIKHKVKWMIKVLKIRNLFPLSFYMHPFLNTTKLLEKIRLHMVFTPFVNILKKFLEQTKIYSFKKMTNLVSYLVIPQILKFTRPCLRLGVLIMIVTCFYFKVCLWH